MNYFRMNYILILLTIQLIPSIVLTQVDSIRTKIERIIKCTNGNIGVAIRGLDNNDTLTIDGNGKYPMQSVYKFPLALAVLNQVDKGALSLEQRIYLKKDDLRQNTWSPLRNKYPEGSINITLDELLTYTVSESDNNGCDILFRIIGGTNVVNQFIHNLGITGIAIVATEEEMSKNWDVQYRNWCSPAAMGQLLYMFYHGQVLSKENEEYLMQLMIKSNTGLRRLKGLLPKETIVAHKTGSSGNNDNGIAAATNDVGIITFPNNKHFIVVVFISNSSFGEEALDEVIANIAKIVWDYYSAQ